MVGDALCGVSFTEFKDVRSESDAVASRLRCKAIPSSLAGDDHENTSSLLGYMPDRVLSVCYRRV